VISSGEHDNAIPLRKLSAFNLPGGRSVAIVLKTYLDGSGKFEDPKSRFLTLAAMFADDDAWGLFESSWHAVLKNEKYSVPYSHMKELLRSDGPFVGWADAKKQGFVRDLFVSLGNRTDLMAASLTIDLSEYRGIVNGRKAKPAEAVCVVSSPE
jgi:hypothetical protein